MEAFDPDAYIAAKEAGTLAPDQSQQASADDFDPDEYLANKNQEQYGGLSSQIGAGLEGAAQGVAGPLATGAELGLNKLGLPGFSPEEIAGRAEANPITHGIGEAAGLTAGLLTGTGEAGLISKGVEAIPTIAKLAEAGTASRVGAAALKGAIETGLIQGGDEISKAMLGQGDPEAPVSSALTMGAAALFGGAIGGIFGTATEGLKALAATKTAKVATEALEDIGARVSLPDEGELSAESYLAKTAPNLKPEAAEILDAADRLNLPVMNGMVSGDKAVRMGEDALLNGPPTVSAIKRQNLYNAAYSKAVDQLSDVLPQQEVTKAQAGQALQTGIVNKISQQYEPISGLYDAIHEVTPNIPLSKFSAPAIARNILRMPEVTQTPNSPMARFARSVAENIQNAKSVEDIAFQRKALKDMANSTVPGERRMAAIIGDKLSDWETSTITKYAKGLNESLKNASPEERQIFGDVSEKINGLLPKMEEAKGAYAPFIKDVGRISEELGKGKVHGPQDAMDFINNLDFEQLTNKLSRKDNSQFRAFFAEKFPDEYKVLQDYQKSALKQAANKTGTFSPKVFFNKVNEMQPEIRQSIFQPEELQKINDINTYIRGFPENFNPSGTSHMSAFRSFFESPTGALIGNTRDLAIEKLIVGKDMSPKVLRALGKKSTGPAAAAATKVLSEGAPESMPDVMEYANKVEKGAFAINKAIGNLFQAGGQQVINSEVSDKDRENIKKYIKNSGLEQQEQNVINQQQSAPTPPPKKYAEGGEVQAQEPVQTAPEPPTDHISKIYPDHSMMLNAAKSRIYNYLGGIRPDQAQASGLPFDAKPDQRMKEKEYNKAIDIAANPLGILNDVKSGHLRLQDMQHFIQMYPELHSHLSKQLTQKISEQQLADQKPPLHTRQGLSLFMGAAMDSTFTPQGIMAAQNVFQQQKAAQSQTPPTKTKKNTSKLGEMSKSFQTSDQAAASRQTSER